MGPLRGLPHDPHLSLVLRLRTPHSAHRTISCEVELVTMTGLPVRVGHRSHKGGVTSARLDGVCATVFVPNHPVIERCCVSAPTTRDGQTRDEQQTQQLLGE